MSVRAPRCFLIWGYLWALTMMFDAMGALASKRNDDPTHASRPYDADREGFVIAGASWAGPDDVWHDGTQTSCVGTDTSVGTRVELGLVDYSDPIVGTGTQVVWLRCLE